jgi:hypothetical protein
MFPKAIDMLNRAAALSLTGSNYSGVVSSSCAMRSASTSLVISSVRVRREVTYTAATPTPKRASPPSIMGKLAGRGIPGPIKYIAIVCTTRPNWQMYLMSHPRPLPASASAIFFVS